MTALLPAPARGQLLPKCCQPVRTERPRATSQKRETRSWSGLRECAQGDSNSHGGNPPQGPQPCASTNSATGACAVADYRRGLRIRLSGLMPSDHTSSLCEHMFVSADKERGAKWSI